MKSIMEEASSVAKAIEKGWAKAGSPKEFLVKIFEYPQRNFFGITVKNAKIALIFDEHQGPISHEEPLKQRPKQKKAGLQRRPPESRSALAPVEQPESQPIWTDQMVSFARDWLKLALEAIDKKVAFTTQVNNDQLFILFEVPIFDNEERNKKLMRPLSQLMVQTLRNHFKKPLRGYKVIMKTVL